jgi:hypothetical protein
VQSAAVYWNDKQVVAISFKSTTGAVRQYGSTASATKVQQTPFSSIFKPIGFFGFQANTIQSIGFLSYNTTCAKKWNKPPTPST